MDAIEEFDPNVIDPRAPARPMVCPVCRTKPGTYYGRLVFRPFAEAFCPMHKTAIKNGALTMQQIVLIAP